MMAIGCLLAFNDAGVRVPDDIALVGFDDIPIARFVSPALTTVRVRIADLGRSALERLASRLDLPNAQESSTQEPSCDIVVRASCGHAKPSASNAGAMSLVSSSAT